jgi:hypothetical protein
MNRYCVIVLVVGCWSFLGGCKRSDDTTDKQPPATSENTKLRSSHDDRLSGVGSIKVIGVGTDTYTVYDASGERVDSAYTGKPMDLPAGTYAVELHQVRREIRIVPDQQTVVDTGSLQVAGDGNDMYDVYDETGSKRLHFTSIGKVVELLPGVYTIMLHQTQQRATVKPGTQATLQAGTLVVSGEGRDLYEVYDQTGSKRLEFTRTNNAMKLFEGTYVVRLRNSSQTVSVRAGEQTVVKTGTLVVSGDGQDSYEVFDESGKERLDFTSTGNVIELLPGAYVVVCRERKCDAVVTAGSRTTIEPE